MWCGLSASAARAFARKGSGALPGRHSGALVWDMRLGYVSSLEQALVAQAHERRCPPRQAASAVSRMSASAATAFATTIGLLSASRSCSGRAHPGHVGRAW